MSTTAPEIGERIKRLCNGKGVTIKQFEREAGLSNGYMRKLTIQQSQPSADRLQKIADYFGVSTDFLLGDEARGNSHGGVRIFLLGRVAAGIPIEAEENIIGDEEISKKMASKGEYFALLIKGDSMAPFIMNGDKVIVRQQNDAENGDIVVALVNGNDGCCKEFKRVNGGIMLISKNPNYDPMIFTQRDVNKQPVRIIGKVVEVRRSL